LTGLKPKPRFGVLVMADESRLGRQGIEIVKAGVRVFFYLEDREGTFGSFTRTSWRPFGA